jgi:hypothetical protein
MNFYAVFDYNGLHSPHAESDVLRRLGLCVGKSEPSEYLRLGVTGN